MADEQPGESRVFLLLFLQKKKFFLHPKPERRATALTARFKPRSGRREFKELFRQTRISCA
jgi:hypothetical protein